MEFVTQTHENRRFSYSGTSNSGYEQLDSTIGAGDAQKYAKSGPLSSCDGANSI